MMRAEAAGWSLRRTLLGLVLSLTVTVWCFSAVVVYLDADTESRELFDQSLAETAHLLLSLANHELSEHAGRTAPALAESNNQKHNQYLLFQVWDGQHHLIYKNTGAPETPFVTDGEGSEGFGWIRMNDQQWRSYTSWDSAHNLQIQVVEPSSHRKEISGRFAYKLLLFVLLIVPLLVAGLWWLVNRVFRSLRQVTDDVAQRMPNDLRQLRLADAPDEVQPLLHALNRLFERVTQSREREQRFTSDAAHELRTPLAAIKTNLQVIQKTRNQQDREEALAGLTASIDRATRLVGQLMTLARLEPPYDKHLPMLPQDLASLLRDELPAWQQQADKAGIRLDASLQTALVRMDRDSLLILFRNLMDNALRYTPAGGQVQLSCSRQDDQVCLQIADDGIGIPEEMRERVFERFFRLSDANTPGSGLGLSIVKNIADTHQARLSLQQGLHGRGLSVCVLFDAYSPEN